jgi:hypothetical protein
VPQPDRGRQNPVDDALEMGINAFAVTFGDRFFAAETR